MPSFFRSAAFSIFAHATTFAVLCAIPSALDQRFKMTGEQSVITIELSLASEPSAATVEIVSPSELESEPLPEKLQSQTTDLQRDPETTMREVPVTLATASIKFEPRPIAMEIQSAQPSPPPEPTARQLEKQLATSFNPEVSFVQPEEHSAGADQETEVDLSANAPPPYPAQAIRARVEGTVVLQIQVSENGSVNRVTVLESSGSADLDDAAVQAVSKWRGQPATRFGRPVASTEVLPIKFRL